MLVVRVGNTWGDFLTIDRLKLKELWVSGCGSENAKSGQLSYAFRFATMGRNQPEPGRLARHLWEVQSDRVSRRLGIPASADARRTCRLYLRRLGKVARLDITHRPARFFFQEDVAESLSSPGLSPVNVGTSS